MFNNLRLVIRPSFFLFSVCLCFSSVLVVLCDLGLLFVIGSTVSGQSTNDFAIGSVVFSEASNTDLAIIGSICVTASMFLKIANIFIASTLSNGVGSNYRLIVAEKLMDEEFGGDSSSSYSKSFLNESSVIVLVCNEFLLLLSSSLILFLQFLILIFFYSSDFLMTALTVFLLYLIFGVLISKLLVRRSVVLDKISRHFAGYSEIFAFFSRNFRLGNTLKTVLRDFEFLSRKFGVYYAFNQVVTASPRLILEGIVIVTVVLLITGGDGDEYVAIGVLALRMIPSVQQLYGCVNNISGSMGTVLEIVRKLSGKALVSSEAPLRRDTFAELSEAIADQQSGLIVILGRSGIGKTSLIREIERSVNRMSDRRLFGTLKVVSLPQASPQLEMNLKDRIFAWQGVEETALKFLVRLGLAGLKERWSLISKFSGGELRRIDLAAILSADADLILLDEPTSGLDESTADLAKELIQEVSHSKVVVVVTHDPTFREFAKRVIHVR